MLDNTSTNHLINGSPAHSTQQLLDLLEQIGISSSTIQHPPLLTVEDAKRHRPITSGGHSKNLFVRNKEGQMWLLTLLENQQLDLKRTAKHLGAGSFTFARPARLMDYLGVVSGAVSPFALINDQSLAVQFILDKNLLEHKTLHFHPLDNCQTTTIASKDLSAFLTHIKHPATVLDFAAIP